MYVYIDIYFMEQTTRLYSFILNFSTLVICYCRLWMLQLLYTNKPNNNRDRKNIYYKTTFHAVSSKPFLLIFITYTILYSKLFHFAFYDRLITHMTSKDYDISTFSDNIYKDNLDSATTLALVISTVFLCVTILITVIICHVRKRRHRGSTEGENNS